MCVHPKRNPIFEYSANEDDGIVVIPYNKRSYLSGKYRLYTLVVQPVACDVQGEDRLRQMIDQYCTLID